MDEGTLLSIASVPCRVTASVVAGCGGSIRTEVTIKVGGRVNGGVRQLLALKFAARDLGSPMEGMPQAHTVAHLMFYSDILRLNESPLR